MRRFLLGPLQLDVGQRVLYRDGEVIALPPKSFDILLVLVENAGHVVSRDAIRQRVWDDAFVEDANVTNYISQLRKVLIQHLGIDPIKTHSKRGYQLVDPLSQCDEAPAAGSADVVSRNASQNSRISRTLAWASLLFVGIIGTAFAAWMHHAARSRAIPSQNPTVFIIGVRDLSLTGEESWVGFPLRSALGSYLAKDKGAVLISDVVGKEAEAGLTIDPDNYQSDSVIRTLGQRLQCRYILAGFYLPVDGQIRIDFMLRDAGSGAVMKEFTQIVPKDHLADAVAQAGGAMRSAMGLHPLDNATAPTGTQAYQDGVRLLRNYRYRDAIDSLSWAELDTTDSPTTHAALAYAIEQVGLDQQAVEEAQLALSHSASLSTDDRLLVEARAYECENQWPKVLAAYVELQRLHPDNLDDALGVARAQIETTQAPQALANLRSLISSSHEAQNDPRIFMQLAEAAQQVSDHHAQLFYAGEAVRLAHASGERDLEAWAMVRESWAWSYMGNNPKGAVEAKAAADLAQQIGNYQTLGAGLSALGQMQHAVYDPGAEATLEQALKYSEEVGARNSMIGILIGLGNLHEDAEDWVDARHEYQRALDLAIQIQRPRRQLAPLVDLADICSHYDDAACEMDYSQRALKIGQEVSNYEDTSFVYQFLAELASRRGDTGDARKNLLQALDDSYKAGNNNRVAYVQMDMIRLELQMGNVPAASQLFGRVKALNLDNPDIQMAQELLGARLDIAEGHPQAAIGPLTDLTTKHPGKVYPAANAWRYIAEIKLDEGRLSEAQSASDKALALSQGSPSALRYRIPAELVSLRIQAAEGHGTNAREQLKALLSEAHRLGSAETEQQIQEEVKRLG